MAEKLLDMSQYRRRAHFDYFRSLPWPYVGVTVDVEVSALLTLCRERGWSFYLVFLHAASLAADTVPELRQRIRGEGIVEYDSCASSHVEALADGTYSYCTLEHQKKGALAVTLGEKGCLTVAEMPVTPLRDVRTARGTLAELTAPERYSEDYVGAVLTDSVPPLDPFNVKKYIPKC